MTRMLRGALLLSMMLASGLAHGAQTFQLARSAQLQIDMRIHDRHAVLHVVRTSDHAPIDAAGRVTADIDGHAAPLTRDGTGYALSLAHLSSGRHTLELVVEHNGIHELLTGTFLLPKAEGGLHLLEKHGYGAWWVLNVVVLLLAARLIMRRKKPPPDSR